MAEVWPKISNIAMAGPLLYWGAFTFLPFTMALAHIVPTYSAAAATKR